MVQTKAAGRRDLDGRLALGLAGKAVAVMARTFPFEQIVEAHRYLESNEPFGKVVVTL
ncbi:zinc-binding dehydrogenase [Paraburkholderia sp. EG287A]|uniref:zinc-binding dehydrogenase n=1 Tax=unclassified Paraburkholderia TaxID=2615204 RepID=UPI0034D3371A